MFQPLLNIIYWMDGSAPKPPIPLLSLTRLSQQPHVETGGHNLLLTHARDHPSPSSVAPPSGHSKAQRWSDEGELDPSPPWRSYKHAMVSSQFPVKMMMAGG